MKQQNMTAEKRTATSRHAQAAKLIRQELNKAFPSTKFKVTSHIYSGGNDVLVEWYDGPPVSTVQEITAKYQEGHFDGSIDLYEYSNVREDIPQVKYVIEQRFLTEKTIKKFAEEYKKMWGLDVSTEDLDSSFDHNNEFRNWRQIAHIKLYEKEIEENTNEWINKKEVQNAN